MSCLFDSLSKFVSINSHDLRQGICDFLDTNPKLLDDMSASDVINFESNMELNRYVANMRQYSTMGGATEIKAFCVMFKMNAKIQSIPNGKTIEFIINDTYPFVYLKWTGGHYDPIAGF